MDKIKEKPQATSSIREKITAVPKELVHRGLEDGTDRLRTQLRDAAQQGRRDDYGGDQIEDTTADSMRRMERGAEKLIKEKRKNRASRDGSSADSTAGDPAGFRPVTRAHPGPATLHPGARAAGSAEVRAGQSRADASASRQRARAYATCRRSPVFRQNCTWEWG